MDATFIILGATGDLNKRKLIPAIYRLIDHKTITKFAYIGLARSDVTSESILKDAKKFIPEKNTKTWKKLVSNTYYQILDFYDEKDYIRLNTLLEKVEKKHHLSGNRIFYLATLPDHFDTISKNLSKFGLARNNKTKWSRVVYEKPFGSDLASAKKINKCINRVFSEDQVYRIDHYLGKELVSNISFIRFTNRILEPLWNNRNVESVQIQMDESIGIGSRGAFYDRYGALKDMIQNHGLQMLSLIAMDPPKTLTGEHVRDEKAKVLQKTKIEDSLLGQYVGYKKELGVSRDSKTETFAALKISIDNKRWKGVPFFIKAGKNLTRKETAIHIKFKQINCLLTRICPTDTNYFTFKIQPEEGLYLELNTKDPNSPKDVLPVKMGFSQRHLFGANTPEAYETLIADVVRGDQSFFVRNDEIEYAWKVIENLEKGNLYTYHPGDVGPKELISWSSKNNIRWK